MKKRKLAILSIGQKPCLRENDDILTRLPEDIEIMQYGALDGLTHLLAPLLTALGVPPETAPLLVIRPLSGSGALAAGSDLMRQYGTDSYIGRCAAVMLGCTETTFYTVAVYFGAAGIRKTRYTVPAALTADAAAFLSAALAVRLFFGQ